MTPTEFQAQVLPLKHQLYRFARSYVGQATEAEDVVQDVLLKAWTYLQGGGTVHNLEAWCMTLVRNRALDLTRSKGRRYQPLSEQMEVASEEAGPLRQVEGQEMMAAVRACMARLPAQQRAVLHLRDVEGYGYEEIADVLGLKPGHVRVLLHRARKQIQLHLKRIISHGINPT